MMKKTINIVVCLATILTLSSCDFFSEKQPVQDSVDSAATVEGISQEIKNKIAAQDTLMNALVLKVDTLAQALSQAQKENAELKVQIDKLESPKRTWGYMTLASLVIAIIALVLSLLRKGLSRDKVDKIFSSNLDKSQRMSKLQDDIEQLKSGQNSNRHFQSAQNLDSRLRSVESSVSCLNSKLKEILNGPIPTGKTRQDNSRQAKESEFHKVGYAKVDTGIYFTALYDSNQEGCVFKLTFTSQSKGKFNILSLDKIQSRNEWQKKVECSGVSIKEATDFRLEDEGVCEKIDENTWKVIKPLKIKLIK